MNKTDLKIGWILALLERGDDINHQPLSQEQHHYLRQLREHLEDIQSSPGADKIINTLPHTTCPMDSPFLSGNDDFFIEVFLNHHKDPLCIELADHLNRCYACFEIFNQVLREYYHKKENLINKS